MEVFADHKALGNQMAPASADLTRFGPLTSAQLRTNTYQPALRQLGTEGPTTPAALRQLGTEGRTSPAAVWVSWVDLLRLPNTLSPCPSDNVLQSFNFYVEET